MKKIFSGIVTAALVLVLGFTDVLGAMPGMPQAQAVETPEITLNGTVSEGDPGYLNSKSLVMATGSETRVNYRLVPGYSSGAASGVTVTIYLPSLEYVDGEYRMVGPGQPATALGMQGRVSAGGGWNVLSDTTVKGGPIVMEYDGDLGSGTNPAFDLFLTTYADAAEGAYSSVPEGTSFEVNGFVQYESFNRAEGSAWQSAEGVDSESRVTAISSDLRWETQIASRAAAGGSDVVPIWDRYQYVDYEYTLENTSDNLASHIDGYSVTFDIDSTDSKVNGIIPFDINRFRPSGEGAYVPNSDPEDTSGQFVGVPGAGGILIYDVTNWDGVSELTEEIPYTYSGTGMVVIDREFGEQRRALTPAGAAGDTAHRYLVSLPLSRQGFPNPPAMFKVAAITNIVFAKSANWSKTRVAEREIVEPSYGVEFAHSVQQSEVVYGYETFHTLSDIRSVSDAPLFDAEIDLQFDPEFVADRLRFSVPLDQLDRYASTRVSYTYVPKDETDEVTASREPVSVERDEAANLATLTFDVAHLADAQWDGALSVSLQDELQPGEVLPVTVQVFGAPFRVGDMRATAAVNAVERYASNTDFNAPTSYTDVSHRTEHDAGFVVVYPDEVVPQIDVQILGTDSGAGSAPGSGEAGTVPFHARGLIDVWFGTNDTTAENTTTTVTLNTTDEVLAEAELTLRAALFAQAQNVRVRYVTLDGETGAIALPQPTADGDVVVSLPDGIAEVLIETDAFASVGAQPFGQISTRAGYGLTESHQVEASMRTYQPQPYDTDATRADTAVLTVQLPRQLQPVVGVGGVYGELRTPDATRVSYESNFTVDFSLTTGGVNSPESVYAIDLLAASKAGGLSFASIAVGEEYVRGATDPLLTFVSRSGERQEFTEWVVDRAAVTLDDIQRIELSAKNLSLETTQTVATVEYVADIELGSTQPVRAVFTGSQEAPYTEDATATHTNTVEVPDTRTGVKVEGVNQVTKPLGVGNEYSVDIYRHWNRGYIYDQEDWTLNQGYKSLGGFTTTLTRPTATYHNNNQTVSVDVALPHSHFDLYYLKIRDDMQPYLQSIDIYRMVGEGNNQTEELWKTVPATDWVDNSQEGAGFWRIATARPDTADTDLFTTLDTVADATNHPYYKDPWDADVRPSAPVSRVVANLQFTRDSNAAAPQIAGVNGDIIEYQGRFFRTSTDGAQPTHLHATDTIGLTMPQTRETSTTINSLVGFPYAHTSTGANDTTALPNKVIPMGSVGEYLASVQNVTTQDWAYYNGHGPNIWSPAATEYDEWLGLYEPESFHDALLYEFVYPASPQSNSVYHLNATHLTIPASSTLKYVTEVRFTDARGGTLTHRFNTAPTTETRFDYDHTRARGVTADGDGSYTVSFGDTNLSPKTVQVQFERISGLGDQTAEIDGVEQDPLGASLAEVDIRVGGIVNGNTALRGTTNLYRIPDDSGKQELLHSTSATLTGYTPRLGAQLSLSFDNRKVYDYAADGITPNTSRAALSIQNSSEADIKDVVLNFVPDPAFRSQLVEIPADIFAGSDWSATQVTLHQGTAQHVIELERFTFNEAGNYALDLTELFADGTLDTSEIEVSLGGEATLQKQHLTQVSVAFTPANDGVALWGSLRRQAAETELPAKMREGGDLFVTGTWVDEEATGSSWLSRPSMVGNTTKASNEAVTHYSAFSANAAVTTYQPIFVNAGSGNSGAKPTLTLNSRNENTAPRVYSRVARLQTHATHLAEDLSRAPGNALFFDADTGTQISATNVAVDDTTKVLYELRNVGTAAPDALSPGNTPVFRPTATVQMPSNLQITGVEATTAELRSVDTRAAVMNESVNTDLGVTAEEVTITTVSAARTDVSFDLTLNDGESVFFFVEFTAVNPNPAQATATQGTTMQWSVFARPDFVHHYMSYNSDGVNGTGVSGTTAALNLDGDAVTEQLGRVNNTPYRFADPKQLQIVSRFDSENVSGETMSLTVQNIRNEIEHDNTNLDVFVTLDRGLRDGFELTAFPTPTYPTADPEWFTGEFAQPRVHFKNASGAWVPVTSVDPARFDLSSVRELWVEYGNVRALQRDGAALEMPAFTIAGVGHWQSVTSPTVKTYVLTAQAQTVLTHHDAAGAVAGAYTFTDTDAVTVYKAIPVVEFNAQSFDTREAAVAPYDGAALGKTSYVAGDPVHVRLTAQNHSTNQGTSTNTPYGKAPLRQPVVIDKVPEYLDTALRGYVSDGVVDIARAVADGVVSIHMLDAAGVPRPFVLPTVTMRETTGLDIGGSQRFADDQSNNGWGVLSSTHPVNTTANPAAEVMFSTFTYTFDQDALGRGERLEIVYAAQAREQVLPVATTADGEAVFAPMFGWYGSNSPVSNTAAGVSMDMATLLHDAGITGALGHEMTPEEFLSRSYAWQMGATNQRRVPTDSSTGNTQKTYYDSSADTQRSHVAYLTEPARAGATTWQLFTAATSTTADENYSYVSQGRVQDGKVTAPQRILWAQDGMQLSRAWLYGASEMLPDGAPREDWGVSAANFYETDRSLNSYNRHRLGWTPFIEDDHSYAVQLHEEFTVRLHASNLGDRAIASGLEYTEVLPLGITPYAADGSLLGVTAFDGTDAALPVSSVEVLQTPDNDQGYRAPAQLQEAGSYADTTRDNLLPYVVRVRVAQPLNGMFNNPGAVEANKNQRVDLRVRVYEELPPSADGISYWHDQFTLTTIAPEAYLEIYSEAYGAFDKPVNGSSNPWRYPNDGMRQGTDLTDLQYDFGYYHSYYSIEPYGRYVRGLNAQNTETTVAGALPEQTKPALVTGDQIAMRVPTLRVWTTTQKDDYGSAFDNSIESFGVQPYEEFSLVTTVENQQLEVLPEYNRSNSGYNRYSGENFNDDIWVNAPQTIGGARGSWFEPTVTIALPYGIAPVLRDGSYARYDTPIAQLQDVDFAATINTVTHSSTAVRDAAVADKLDVRVELDDRAATGPRFVLHFSVRDPQTADVAYGESLVISPRVTVIDTPLHTEGGSAADDPRYESVLAFANTDRPVFTPVVSGRYSTGSVTSQTTRDRGSLNGGTGYPNAVTGQPITSNDRTRLDSTSQWSSNMGVLKITECLISATQPYAPETAVLPQTELSCADELQPLEPGVHHKFGAVGGTQLNLLQPAIENTTSAVTFAGDPESDLLQVDPAGTFWFATQVRNTPHTGERSGTNNPYEHHKTSADVANSRFVVTQFMTNFAETTGEVRLQVGGTVLTPAEYTALGYRVQQLSPAPNTPDALRQRVQWVVTTPQNDRGTHGLLVSGEQFTLLAQVQLVAGYEDHRSDGTDAWQADELRVDSFVSLISDDTTLIAGAQRAADFIVQALPTMGYTTHTTDVGRDFDVDDSGQLDGYYAHDTTTIEIRKPNGEVRINTARPRIMYSNGKSGDTYFNSADTIEYLVTHARNTGSALKHFAVETILPTNETAESSVAVSTQPIETSTLFTSTGVWALPAETLARLAADGREVDDVFRTFVYYSHEPAVDGYEDPTLAGWQLLNPGGSSLAVNAQVEIPDGADRRDVRKIRTVVTSLEPDTYLVPQGLRLDVDADAETIAVREDVTQLDPENHATEAFPESVLEHAIIVGMRASSDASSTLFVHANAQAWGNYVGENVTLLDQSATRSYLTPSRPVVNVHYDALYYRSDFTKPGDQRFGWSDVTAIDPDRSPYLKFTGTFVNADDSMWHESERNVYSADTLIDPFVTFHLPTVMLPEGEPTYVAQTDITADHPLSADHRSRYTLTPSDNNQWTWRIEGANGRPAHPDSHLEHVSIMAGGWSGFDRNVVSVQFSGIVYPGDQLVVEFIGSVDAYAPGADAEDLKSRAVITNNTGLLQPLNSEQNQGNKLGYTVDNFDFNDNDQANDRLVFHEKTLFQYDTYDNFGKRKVAFSDLKPAGTVAPATTPVREGGNFSFDVSVDNSKEANARSYPYPILYDVLPFVGDTSITDADTPRKSGFQAWLNPDSVQLTVTGAQQPAGTTPAPGRLVPGTVPKNQYTVFVGPFTRQGDTIVESTLVPHAQTGTEAFYNALGVPGAASALRDAHFVTLDELRTQPELLQRATSLLVLFNNSAAHLPGQSKLSLSYDMQAPLNAPVYLEASGSATQKTAATLWNSFVATLRENSFLPQESNNAGIVVTEQRDTVSIGNYVWHDRNFNGTPDEGTLETDANGRELLTPTTDLDGDGNIDDPGINDVTVWLLSPGGHNVDLQGRPIAPHNNGWAVVRDTDGTLIRDDVFGDPIESTGPMRTVTQTDIHGHHGYYTFSNITPGEYRVLFEFPDTHARYGATTEHVLEDSTLTTYLPGQLPEIPAAVNPTAMNVLSGSANVHLGRTDDERMSFDLGVAHTLNVGGTVFTEQRPSSGTTPNVDGYQEPGEPGLAGYHVTLRHHDGTAVQDAYGNDLVTRTNSDGEYVFTMLPTERDYHVTVTNELNEWSDEIVVSPYVFNANPFAEVNDNDGYSERGTRIVRTNDFTINLDELYATQFADQLSVSVGFYTRAATGIIGNRVWHDLNRDGVQDSGEPGIAGQRLELWQYLETADGWQRNTEFPLTEQTTNTDGYYYFRDVPAAGEARYQVVVASLPPGFTFAPTNVGANDDGSASEQAEQVDSDFYSNGTMHAAEAGSHLVSVLDDTAEIALGIDHTSVDLGLMPFARGEISGTVFDDVNGNHLNDDEQPGAPRYTATLQVWFDGAWVDARRTPDGAMVEPAAATDADPVIAVHHAAAYRFAGLHLVDPQNPEQRYEYRVVVSQIPLWKTLSDPNIGADDTVDSDFTAQDGRDTAQSAVSDVIVLGRDDTQTAAPLLPTDTATPVTADRVDLGLRQLTTQVSIGDTLWIDANANGLQDDTEFGAPGLTVTLHRVIDSTLVPVATDVTGPNGGYEFVADIAENDPENPNYTKPHSYAVSFTLDSHHSLSPYRTGTGTDPYQPDSAMQPLHAHPELIHTLEDAAHTVITDRFELAPRDDNGNTVYEAAAGRNDLDGGIIAHHTQRVIGDVLFSDTNRDGIQDDGEPGLPGLTVRLLWQNPETGAWEPRADNHGNTSQLTDAAGRYEFAVEIADLDKQSPHYRDVLQYRVLAETPSNMRLVGLNTPFGYAAPDTTEAAAVERPHSWVLSGPLQLADADPTGVVLQSARDELAVDAGFAVHPTEVEIGGTFWDDAEFDGLRTADERPVTGTTVRLWELVDGVWAHTTDLRGRNTVTTDTDGNYRFALEPTHYDELAPNYLEPRVYRVTAERPGHAEWSPLHVGDDRTRDSDVMALESTGAPTHTGASQSFEIATVDENASTVDRTVIDLASVRSDVHRDFGWFAHPDRAIVGGTVWDDHIEDAVHDHHEDPLTAETVTLWERIDETWQVATDLNGASTQRTGTDGQYRFVVAPLIYDLASDRYLEPREYRTTVTLSDGTRLTSGGHNLTLAEALVASAPAYLGVPDAAGITALGQVRDDLTLNFPLLRDEVETEEPGGGADADAVPDADADPGLELPGGDTDPAIEQPGGNTDPGIVLPGADAAADPAIEQPAEGSDPDTETPGEGTDVDAGADAGADSGADSGADADAGSDAGAGADAAADPIAEVPGAGVDPVVGAPGVNDTPLQEAASAHDVPALPLTGGQRTLAGLLGMLLIGGGLILFGIRRLRAQHEHEETQA